MEPNVDTVNHNDPIKRVLSRWSTLIVAGMLGALLGLIYSYFRPPIYQAEAILGVNINYGVTEPLELIVEDRVLNRVAAVIMADKTLGRVLDETSESVRKDRQWEEPSDLRQSIRIDQRLAEWGLVVVDPDPVTAANIAQLWAYSSLQVLDEATEHAWRALALLGESFDVECDLIRAEDGTSRGWTCQVEPLDLDPDSLSGELQKEIARSKGILPNLSYELLRDASPPSSPVVWDRGTVILAGALIGLLGGFGLEILGLAKRD
jgi:LPS O-antigen subunit length determinant protein (WzzB/FepE family)